MVQFRNMLADKQQGLGQKKAKMLLLAAWLSYAFTLLLVVTVLMTDFYITCWACRGYGALGSGFRGILLVSSIATLLTPMGLLPATLILYFLQRYRKLIILSKTALWVSVIGCLVFSIIIFSS